MMKSLIFLAILTNVFVVKRAYKDLKTIPLKASAFYSVFGLLLISYIIVLGYAIFYLRYEIEPPMIFHFVLTFYFIMLAIVSALQYIDAEMRLKHLKQNKEETENQGVTND